jgi:hypothetical protein
MDIRITKKGSRNVLSCARPDGTTASADIGPNLPHHDLAHFAVERAFALPDGFFGNIARGYTPAQLSDRDVIRSLGVEPYRAEILARALESLQTGACSPQQFEDLVNSELTSLGLPSMIIEPARRDALLAEFNGHLATYRRLRDGESMTLAFSMPSQRPSRALPAAVGGRRKPKLPRSAASVDTLSGLGPYSRNVLAQAGIHTLAELRRVGPVSAFLAAKAIDNRVSLNLLWGIAGALTDTHWSDLSEECRETLLREYDAACDLQTSAPPPPDSSSGKP